MEQDGGATNRLQLRANEWSTHQRDIKINEFKIVLKTKSFR